MPRIAGIDLPDNKRLDIALTHVRGIGRKNVLTILEAVQITPDRKAVSLTDEELGKISGYIEKNLVVEGALRQQTIANIKRLRDISSYRGLRHAKSLPSRGQRTKSNARTKRGRRQTVGALKKEDRAKMETKPADK